MASGRDFLGDFVTPRSFRVILLSAASANETNRSLFAGTLILTGCENRPTKDKCLLI